MATRVIRWIEGVRGGKPALRWNQLKSVQHPVKEDQTIDASTDRKIDYVTQKENPQYIKPEERTGKTVLTRAQRSQFTPVFKFPKTFREELQKGVEAILDHLQSLHKEGVIQSFKYTLNENTVQYTIEYTVENSKFTTQESSDDETVLEAVNTLSEQLVNIISTTEKPVTLALPVSEQFFVEEPEEPEEP